MFEEIKSFAIIRVNQTYPMFKALYQQRKNPIYDPDSEALLWEITRGIWTGLTHIQGVKYAVSVSKQEVKSVFNIGGISKRFGSISEAEKREIFPIRIAADADFLNLDPNRSFLLGPQEGISLINQELTAKYRGQSIRGLPPFQGFGSPVTIHRS